MSHYPASRVMAAIVAALTCAGVARAAEEIHPEDAACRLPCEVHDTEPRQAARDDVAASAPRAVARDRLVIAQARTGDEKRTAALARQRVAR